MQIGDVVRLHTKTEPNKVKLYMIVEGIMDSYSQGKISMRTAKTWDKHPNLSVTVYKKESCTTG